jgi:cobalt-zinc-cadmium efflux system membrane fusion protein
MKPRGFGKENVKRVGSSSPGTLPPIVQKWSWSPLRGGILALLVLLIPVAAAGCAGNSNPAVGQAGIPVTAAKVESGRLSYGNLLTGKVAASEEVNLSPKIPGRVGVITVEVGQEVKAGQIVLILDAPEIEAALSQAEAAVGVAEAGSAQADLGVQKARAGLDQARESFDLAKANYERGELLLREEAIAQADFEARFEQPYVTASGALRIAEASLNQAVDQRDRVAPAQLNQARAALAVARANAANTVLTAPIDGIVSARNVDPGELTFTAAPAVTIVNIDEVLIECGVSEQQVNELKTGQEVKVTVPALGAGPFVGQIRTISPAVDPRTKTYGVQVCVPNPGHLLKPGMFAETDLNIAAEDLLVPCGAIVTEDGTMSVFVVLENKAVLRKVKTGPSDGRYTIIKEGLDPGDQVVVSGLDKIRSGTRLKVTDQYIRLDPAQQR